MSEKQCVTCHEVKDVEDFEWHSPGKRRGQCWSCRQAVRKKNKPETAPVEAEPIRYPFWGGPVFDRILVGRL